MESKYDILNEFEHNIMLIQEVFQTSGPTDNLQINALCEYLFDKDYIGTYTAENIPKDIENGNMFIANTITSNETKNGHWVAFAKKDGKLYYYDSFGRDKSISPYWKNIDMINANKTGQDQATTQENCSSYAISFLISFYNNGEEVLNVI